MRIRRSVTRFFGALVLPALTVAVVGYFGGHALWGDVGLLQLRHVQSRLALQQATLRSVAGQRDRLAHRVHLMEPAHPDPDLVEELARRELMDGAPNQVAIPRAGH